MIECPRHGDRQELFYSSAKHFTKRCYVRFPDNFKRPFPIGIPVVNKAIAHYMLAYDDMSRYYYIYTKCIDPPDAVIIANTLVSTRAAQAIEIWSCTPDPPRIDYVHEALVFLFENPYPALALEETLRNFVHTFKELLQARGYILRRYYDDVDEGLPVTRHTPWRPKRPKGGKGWRELLNLRSTVFQ